MPERTITKLFQKWDYGKIQYVVQRGWRGGDKPVLEMFVQPRAEEGELFTAADYQRETFEC